MPHKSFACKTVAMEGTPAQTRSSGVVISLLVWRWLASHSRKSQTQAGQANDIVQLPPDEFVSCFCAACGQAATTVVFNRLFCALHSAAACNSTQLGSAAQELKESADNIF
jgi:hypothetical protein